MANSSEIGSPPPSQLTLAILSQTENGTWPSPLKPKHPLRTREDFWTILASQTDLLYANDIKVWLP